MGRDGRCFVNESDSYPDFCMGMIRAGLSESWLVVDDRSIHRYGLGLALPGGRGLGRLLRKNYLVRGATLPDLARRIGADAAGLAESVAANNRFAARGRDQAFGRGTSVMHRSNGDPEVAGNPCLGPPDKAPSSALKVVPVDLTGAGGLWIDPNGGVLDPQCGVIAGLHACGMTQVRCSAEPIPAPAPRSALRSARRW